MSFAKDSCCALSDHIGYYVTFRDTVARLAGYPPFKGISTLMIKVLPRLHRFDNPMQHLKCSELHLSFHIDVLCSDFLIETQSLFMSDS